MAVTVTFISTNNGTVVGSTLTFTNQAIGSSATDRIVAVGVYYNTSAATAMSSTTVSGVSIGGVTADQLVVSSQGSIYTGVFSAPVPTSSQANIAVGISDVSSVGSLGIIVFTVTGAASSPSDTDTAQSSANISILSISALTVDSGGAGIACLGKGGSSGVNIVWTNSTLAADSFVSSGPTIFLQKCGSRVLASGTVTISGSWVSATPGSLMGVSWTPAVLTVPSFDFVVAMPVGRRKPAMVAY